MRGGGRRCLTLAVAIATIALVLGSLLWGVHSIQEILAVTSSSSSSSSSTTSTSAQRRVRSFDEGQPLPSPQQDGTKPPHNTILLCSYLFGEANANKKFLQLFLRSAAGSGVDVVLVGDVRPLSSSVIMGSGSSTTSSSSTAGWPPNVRHYPISWDEFVTLAERRLSFNGTRLRTAGTRHHRRGVVGGGGSRPYYKIIDFKPLFGHLFPQLVANYTWWGHVDNDVLLGDIAGLAGPYLADRDVISGNDTYSTWGPLTLYRNDDRINTLFQKSVLTPQELFGIPRAVYFDEWMGWGPYRNKKPETDVVVEPRSMSKIVDRYVNASRVQRSIGPYGKDRSCKWNLTDRCGECFFLQSSSSSSSSSSSVAAASDDENVADAVPRRRRNLLVNWDASSGQYVQVLLCHYKITKDRIESLLRQQEDEEEEAAAGEKRDDPTPTNPRLGPHNLDEFRVNGVDGVQPILLHDRAKLDAFLLTMTLSPSG